MRTTLKTMEIYQETKLEIAIAYWAKISNIYFDQLNSWTHLITGENKMRQRVKESHKSDAKPRLVLAIRQFPRRNLGTQLHNGFDCRSIHFSEVIGYSFKQQQHRFRPVKLVIIAKKVFERFRPINFNSAKVKMRGNAKSDSAFGNDHHSMVCEK